ncbi:MAG: N-6 DNA methylase [Thiolinea sp.]
MTRSSDGQMLFLANMISKMKHDSPLGSRIAEVHNGSSLFTGDAGQGESNIRRWIIENDWLEAIVALPLNMFYNTGIATYVWVLTNRKPENRKGQVQLIDATQWFQPLRKNMGKKKIVSWGRMTSNAFVTLSSILKNRRTPNAFPMQSLVTGKSRWSARYVCIVGSAVKRLKVYALLLAMLRCVARCMMSWVRICLRIPLMCVSS